MSDEDFEEKYAKLLNVQKHLDAIKEDWDEETMEQLKEFMREKYSQGNVDIPSQNTSIPFDSNFEGSYQGESEGILTRIKDAFDKDVGIDPGRILGLTDGIFGMVMTLLVFAIAIPEMTGYSYDNFITAISSLLPSIGITIVSFVIISSFWIYHHEYIKLKNLNILYLWLNIFFLICISFIPFSTSLIGTYSHFFLSEMVFGVNILLTIIAFLLMYVYANSKDFFENKPSKKVKDHVLITLASIMGLSIIVNLLDFFISGDFIYLFLFIPIISTILDTWFRYKNS